MEKLFKRYMPLSVKVPKRNMFTDKCVPRIYRKRSIRRPSTKLQKQTKIGPILLKVSFVKAAFKLPAET